LHKEPQIIIKNSLKPYSHILWWKTQYHANPHFLCDVAVDIEWPSFRVATPT